MKKIKEVIIIIIVLSNSSSTFEFVSQSSNFAESNFSGFVENRVQICHNYPNFHHTDNPFSSILLWYMQILNLILTYAKKLLIESWNIYQQKSPFFLILSPLFSLLSHWKLTTLIRLNLELCPKNIIFGPILPHLPKFWDFE